MEYNLQKSIENNLGYLFPTTSHFQLTSYPNIDYVNPGIGCVARMHSIYVPMYVNNRYSINKEDQPLKMEGKGNENEMDKSVDEITDQKNADNISDHGKEKNSDNDKDAIMADIEKQDLNPVQFNERKRKLLEEGVFDSFQNAKIKTGRISLSALKNADSKSIEKNKIKKNKVEKLPNHKFSFSD